MHDADAQLHELAHDLLQSIAAVGAVVEALRPDVPASAAATFELVEREVRAMEAICADVLADAVPSRPVDLPRLVHDVVVRTRPAVPCRIELHGVEEAGGTELVLEADPVAWSRALRNLLDNAGRAAGTSGTVRVVVAQGAGTLSVDVADSGPGFGLGDRGQASLGLSQVFQLVDRHRGHVEVRRSEMGGATVRLVIPVVDDIGPRGATPS